MTKEIQPITIIISLLVGAVLGAIIFSKYYEASFITTAGFPCNEQEHTTSCSRMYNYRNIPLDEVVGILGQVIKHQGGEFELIE